MNIMIRVMHVMFACVLKYNVLGDVCMYDMMGYVMYVCYVVLCVYVMYVVYVCMLSMRVMYACMLCNV